MEDLLNQITGVSQELKTLSAELQWARFSEREPQEQNQIIDGLLTAGVGEELRRAVDLLNHFLWSYIESVASGPNDEVDYARQSMRLGQVTELLRLLQHSSCPLQHSFSAVESAAMTITRHVRVGPPEPELSLEKSA